MNIPDEPFLFRHRLPVQIRFNDIDILGHLNNVVYLEFMDLGKINYFRQFMPEGHFNWESLGLVIANINIDYVTPTFIHDSLDVLTAVERIGTKSLVLAQRIVDRNTGEVKAKARVTMVCYSTRTGRTEEISPEWRSTLEKYEGRKL